MKVLKKNYNYINVSLFVVASLIYIYSLVAISKGQSVLDIFTKPILDPIGMILSAVAIVVLFNVRLFRKISEKWLMFFICVAILRCFLLLTSNFNKIILILSFLYIFFAFYFYITWEVELKRSCYNPKFEKNDLNKHERFPLEAVLKIDERSLPCHISNIDETGLFVIFKQSKSSKADLLSSLEMNKDVEVEVIVDHVHFRQRAIIIGQYDLGLGLSYLKNNERDSAFKTYDFGQLYEVLIDRGLFI